MSKTSITVPWSEGKAEDFTELHEALSSGKTENFSAHDQEDCGENKFSESESEEDEAEVEPSPDDHGLNLFQPSVFNILGLIIYLKAWLQYA